MAVCAGRWLRLFPDTIGWGHLLVCASVLGAVTGWATLASLRVPVEPLPQMLIPGRWRVLPRRSVCFAVGLLALGVTGSVLAPTSAEATEVRALSLEEALAPPPEEPRSRGDCWCGTEPVEPHCR